MSKPEYCPSTTTDFLEKLGPSKKECYIVYAEHNPKRPKEFETPNGWRLAPSSFNKVVAYKELKPTT